MRTIIIIVTVFFSLQLYSQTDGSMSHNHDHAKHLHNDFGIANTMLMFPSEEQGHYELHLHNIKGLTEKLGVGFATT